MTLHHNKMDRECRGSTRGLAGLPRAAAEVLEGYFSGHRVPLRSVGSKSQAGLPSLQHQSWKETQKTSSCEKQQGFCLPGTDNWRFREPLKGPTHKISFAAIYPGLWQREGSVD